MTKDNHDYLQNLPSSKFYLDDLAEIEQILCGACNTLEIFVGNRRLTNLSELAQASDEERTNLRMLGQGPPVSIEFKPHNTVICTQENNPLSKSIAPRVKQVIYAGKARLLMLFFLSFVTVCLGLWLMIKGQSGLIVILLGWTWYMAIWWADRRRRTIIKPMLRSQETSYIKRNKDEFPVLLISLAFIAMISIMLSPVFFK